MDMKQTIKQVKPNLFKKVVVEEPSFFKGRKAQARYNIHHQVFDLYDSVADNAKLISLLFRIITELWNALPSDVKSNISSEKQELIEYVVNLASSTKTRLDKQMSIEGTNVIDRLFSRQQAIANLIS